MRRYIIVLGAVLLLGSRSVATQISASESGSTCLAFFQSTCRTLVCALSRGIVEPFRGTLLFAPRADGGGDGGGDGSGGSDGGGDGSGGNGGASDGGGDSGGDGGNGAGNGDGTGTDTGTVGDPGDPGSLGNNNDAAEPSALSDPTTVADNAVVDVPTNDPALGLRGPGSPGSDVTVNGSARLIPSPLGVPVPSVPVDVGINAVIVSGAPTPWEAVGKGPGVQSVTVTGGIVALGVTALAKPTVGISVGAADKPPDWLKLKPDLRYLNGSLLPPVVPNVIDVRTISYTEEVIENPHN